MQGEYTMVTLSMLLSKNEFSNFRLLSGGEGLDNIVSVAAFFEWEDEQHIVKDLIPGSFVLTTLSLYKDNLKEAERYMKVMINNHVAGIAIKDIFFDDISDDLKEYSNRYKVPIFAFSETYINNLICLIQNEVDDDKNYSVNGSLLEVMLKNNSLSSAQKQELLRKINAYFKTDAVQAMFFSDESADVPDANALSERYQELIYHLRMLLQSAGQGENPIQAFALYKRGAFLLLSCEGNKTDAMQQYTERLKQLIAKSEHMKNYYIGESACEPGTEIENLLTTAIIANTSAILTDEQIKNISETGADSVIFGNIKTKASEEFFQRTMETLEKAERTGTPFRETLLAYAECGGNIEQTAESLHQHKNTVRYRIDRINKMFGDNDPIITAGNVFYFTRLYQARGYLEELI